MNTDLWNYYVLKVSILLELQRMGLSTTPLQNPKISYTVSFLMALRNFFSHISHMPGLTYLSKFVNV